MYKVQNDGGSAFPALDHTGTVLALREYGMSMRDYFAAKAIQAMITKSNAQDMNNYGGRNGVPLIAKFAYEFADAMLTERAKQ